jgi:hypothetical protein
MAHVQSCDNPERNGEPSHLDDNGALDTIQCVCAPALADDDDAF